MGRIEIPLVNNTFPVDVLLRTPGGGNAGITIRALIDTGASATCVGFSAVSKLGVQPIASFSVNQIAGNNFLFSRLFPLNVGLASQIFRVMPCNVMFQTQVFLTAVSTTDTALPQEELEIECQKLGIARPDTVIAVNSKRDDGNFDRTFFRPGIGLEQDPLLIGMDFLSQYDWSFSAKSRALIITF